MICIGGGNHYRDINEIAHRCGVRITDVYDDDADTGWPVPPGCLSRPLIVGVNDPLERRSIVHRFSHLYGAAPLIDPSAIVGRDVHCGRGTVVAPLASLLHSVTLGDHVHVNTMAQMVRTNVDDFTTISPGAHICGNVEIGEACAIGAGATICERVKIGDFVTVGAGAVVPPYSIIPNGKTVIGVWKNV